MSRLFSAKQIFVGMTFLFITLVVLIVDFEEFASPSVDVSKVLDSIPRLEGNTNEDISKKPNQSTQCQKAYDLGPNKWYMENCR